MAKNKKILINVNEKDLKKLKFRFNTQYYTEAVRIAVKLCANMNRADLNQFLAVYHSKVKKSLDFDKDYKYYNDKINLDIIILWKIFGWNKKDLTNYLGVSAKQLDKWLKSRNLNWKTILEDETKILYEGKDGKITHTGGSLKKKKRRRKKKYKPKKDRHRKYYRVRKKSNKSYKQGFVYRYEWSKNKKKHHIDAPTLDELKRKVELRGLEWRKLELYKGEFNRKEDKYNEYLKWRKENVNNQN